ncbi:MAG: hypothetical protein QOE11_1060 [Solirubrobacteraceae bacterium]|nr:hypothetical protein [Solirubrobacteraceae bacterium]
MDRSEDVAPWREPVRGGYPDPALAGLPGVEQVRALMEGRAPAPPISHLLGMSVTDVGVAAVAFSMPATRWLLSSQGVISLGTLAILADGPLGCSVHGALPAGTVYGTSELSLRLLRPARAAGNLVARGRLIHAGRSLALSGVQIFDGAGRLLADGSSLCFVRPARGLRDDGATAEAATGDGRPARTEPADPYERPVVGEVLGEDVWERMSGLEILRAQLAGDLPLPPIHHLTGVALTAAGPEEAVFELPCHEWLCSPLATVEGGVIAMLADCALVSAIQTVAPPGTAAAAVDLKVNFLRPVAPDGRTLTARGRVRHAGRAISVAEAEVVNADGKTVALATGSAVMRGRR